MQLKE